MMVGGVDIRWSPKLRPEKLQRLYETDARGIVDEELIDEVGYTLYSRCDSILTVTEAFAGRLKCPRCSVVSERETGTGGAAARLHCPGCGWEASWHEYHKSWQHRQLWGGNAVPVFQEFVRRFPTATTPRQKMLLIDQLIHGYHHDLRRDCYNRPAAANLIEGGLKQVIEFLDRLTYGEGSTPGLGQARSAWREKVEITRKGLSRSEMKRQGLRRSAEAMPTDDPAGTGAATRFSPAIE
jgi:predicted RNA-binding Zn-ribbon protein involved in translation (DUF1610 family)